MGDARRPGRGLRLVAGFKRGDLVFTHLTARIPGTDLDPASKLCRRLSRRLADLP